VHALQNNGVDMSHVSISRSYAVLVGIEGYMKFKQKKKDVKEKIEEEKSKKTSSNDRNDSREGDVPEISKSRPTQEKVGTMETVNRVDTAESEKQPASKSGGKKAVFAAIARTFSRRGSRESKTVEIRGRGIPGTAPEEGVPAPEGHR
jgi:hypothetical protein